MLRKLLGAVVAVALPSILGAQAPVTPTAGSVVMRPRGVAMQVQGEVVSAIDEIQGANNQGGVDEANGQNNDVDDGDMEQEGFDLDEPDGLNNDVDAGEQVNQNDQEGEGDVDQPAPPPGTGQIGQIGRHRP